VASPAASPLPASAASRAAAAQLGLAPLSDSKLEALDALPPGERFSTYILPLGERFLAHALPPGERMPVCPSRCDDLRFSGTWHCHIACHQHHVLSHKTSEEMPCYCRPGRQAGRTLQVCIAVP